MGRNSEKLDPVWIVVRHVYPDGSAKYGVGRMERFDAEVFRHPVYETYEEATQAAALRELGGPSGQWIPENAAEEVP